MRLNKGQLIGISLILGALGLIIYQATKSESTVTFYTPAEVYGNIPFFEGKLFRVSGLVLGGSLIWEQGKTGVTFTISDLKGHEFIVNYKGLPPDLFKEGQGVVVEGRLRETHMRPAHLQATLLMVKHSEVYDTQEDHSTMKEAKLLESILKNEKTKNTAQ